MYTGFFFVYIEIVHMGKFSIYWAFGRKGFGFDTTIEVGSITKVLPKEKRLGRMFLDLGYVVDLDDEEMVENAKDCISEDVMSAVKYNEVTSLIHIVESPDADEGDIPEFLLDNYDN